MREMEFYFDFYLHIMTVELTYSYFLFIYMVKLIYSRIAGFVMCGSVFFVECYNFSGIEVSFQFRVLC